MLTPMRCLTHRFFGALLLAALAAASLPGATAWAQAPAPEWGPVGAPGFSAGQVYYTDVARSGQRDIFVAFMDFANGHRATVMRYDGAAWNILGTPGFSAGQIDGVRLAVDGAGRPYVAYVDYAQGYKASVMRYDASAGWQALGGAGFSAGDVGYISLALDRDGRPYVAFADGAADYKATVLRWDGAAWQAVGQAGFSAGEASYVSLVLDGQDRPCVSFADAALGGKVTVMQYDGAGAWQTVGAPGFSTGTASATALALDGQGAIFVAYQDGSNGGKATAMRHTTGGDATRTGWQPVGMPGFSAGAADYIDLALDGQGTPYVAFKDHAAANRATVMKFDAGEGWVPVGPMGFSAAAADYVGLVLSDQGVPIVAYADWQNAGRATVMTFGGDRTPPVVTITVDPNSQVAASGWYNLASSGAAGVRVDVSAGDPSGVAHISCQDGKGRIVLDAAASGGSFVLRDGVHDITCLATDGAGNSGASQGSSPMPAHHAVDQTPPVARGTAAPAANANGWHNSDVTVAFVGDDGDGSGSASCTSVTLTAETSGASVTGTCTDLAGNTGAPVTVGDIQIDKTAPVIVGQRVPAPNSAGWNNGPINVTFTCTDSGPVQSGIDQDTLVGAALNHDGRDQSVTGSGTCMDRAGNAAVPAAVSGINIDMTPPVLANLPPDATLAGAADGARFSYPEPAATDNLDLAPRVGCAPEAGALFPRGTTPVTCTAEDAAGNVSRGSFKVTVTGGVTLRLLDSQGNGLAGATAQYHNATGWQSIPGSTGADGTLSSNLAGVSQAVAFRLTYAHGSFEKIQDVVADPVVIFRTARVTVRLKDSSGAPMPEAMGTGRAQYWAANSWHDLGQTVGGEVSRELLPLAYPFAMTYAGARQVKLQNVALAPVVVFQTTKVTVELRDSTGALLSGAAGAGQAGYLAADGWHDLGQTAGGRVSKELLPLPYAFSMVFAFARQDKLQMAGLNPTVVFKTARVTVELRDAQGNLVPDSAGTGKAQYYAAGRWHELGQTSGGQARKELLPVLYNFSLDFASRRQEKWQLVALKRIVAFNMDRFR